VPLTTGIFPNTIDVSEVMGGLDVTAVRNAVEKFAALPIESLHSGSWAITWGELEAAQQPDAPRAVARLVS
jgi:hypothetical protein